MHLVHSARWVGWVQIDCDAAEMMIDAGLVTRNPIGTVLDTDSEVVVEWVSPNGTPIMRDVFAKGTSNGRCAHWVLGDS